MICYLLTICKLLWWGKIFNAYKKDKISPCDDVVTSCVICCFFCMTLRAMWFVVLNAIFFHFYHFHPYPSPGTGNCCHLKKHRKIALFHCIALFYRHMIPNGVIFGIIEQKFENDESESTGQKNGYVAHHALHISHFLVITIHFTIVNTIYHNIVNLIYYHLLNYP